jgi:hypothetical protein
MWISDRVRVQAPGVGPAPRHLSVGARTSGRPTALAVFSSDNMSSVAYATEEILRVLIPAIGILAFTYVLPISA